MTKVGVRISLQRRNSINQIFLSSPSSLRRLSQFSFKFILNLCFVASFWITSAFLFGLFGKCKSSFSILRQSVCLQESDKLLFGIELFLVENLRHLDELLFGHLLVLFSLLPTFLISHLLCKFYVLRDIS